MTKPTTEREALREAFERARDFAAQAVLLHIVSAGEADWARFGERYSAWVESLPPGPPDSEESLRRLLHLDGCS